MRVPLVVVTGFLGAGKTTLINRLLAWREQRGARGKIAVIVNELGEIGIDGELLGRDTRQVELPGGCVCCVLGDELDRTLLDVVRVNPGLEAIVLETTGVAEPLPIAWAVRRDEVAAKVRLSAVVTLVDATRFRASRPLSASVDAQVANADVLLVTKGMLPLEDLAVARALAPRAMVRTGTTDEHVEWLETVLEDPDIEHAPIEHAHDHAHDHGIESMSAWIERDVDLEEFEDQIAELPASYIRIKGIVRDGERWFAVHRVGLRVSSEAIRAPDDRRGRLVVLGSDLSRERLASCIDAAARS